MSETTPAPDRPRTRRWESLLGVVGRVLVSAGLLLLAFVGYQLWGTGIEQAQRQDSLNSEFEALLASTTTVAPTTTTVVPTSTTSTPTAPEPTTPPTPDPTTAPLTTAPPAPPLDTGDPVARLVIPSLDVSQVVVLGVGTGELKMGPGHFPGTPLPGELGNAAIAGHRTSYGAPFADIDQLEVGDEIVLSTLAGEFVYRVSGAQIVQPTAVEVVDTVDASRATLTLVTCHPRFSTRQRLIVSAELDQTRSPEPVIPAPTSTVAPSTTIVVAPGDTSVPPSTVAPPASIDEVDPFAAGWFADDGAWWHVAGWGLLLIGIALGATRLGRARQNERLGAVVGFVPFLVVLYFFFQNVNRLLPPGL